MLNATRLDIPMETIEREVALRLGRCSHGHAGIGVSPVLSNGHGEILYRAANGEAIGVLGFCGHLIEDYCVARRARRLGIATVMADHARRMFGARVISGPFTPDGFAFASAWTHRKA